jgi:hypothetical protein
MVSYSFLLQRRPTKSEFFQVLGGLAFFFVLFRYGVPFSQYTLLLNVVGFLGVVRVAVLKGQLLAVLAVILLVVADLFIGVTGYGPLGLPNVDWSHLAIALSIYCFSVSLENITRW